MLSSMLCMQQKVRTFKPLYTFFGDVKYKPLLVLVIWPDSGCVQNVSTNFYFPQLSPSLAGLEKSIQKRKEMSMGLGGAFFINLITKSLFRTLKFVFLLTHKACASNSVLEKLGYFPPPFSQCCSFLIQVQFPVKQQLISIPKLVY